MRITNQPKPITVLIYAAVVLALTLAMFSAHADGVYTCRTLAAEFTQYFGCGAANVVIVDLPLPTDIVPVAAPGTVLGRQSFWYTSPAVTWQKWSSTTPTSIIGICGGNERDVERCAFGNGGDSSLRIKSQILGLPPEEPAIPFVYHPMSCFPRSFDEIRFRVSQGYLVVLLYCDKPTGIVPAPYGFRFNGESMLTAAELSNKTQAELAALHKLVINRSLTKTEFAIAQELNATQGIKATVENGSYPDAPMYTRNSDGTRGPAVKERVKVGAECNWQMRLQKFTSSGAVGTSYYAVVGESDRYANCKIEGAYSR